MILQRNDNQKAGQLTCFYFFDKLEFVGLFLVRVVAGFHACTRSLREGVIKAINKLPPSLTSFVPPPSKREGTGRCGHRPLQIATQFRNFAFCILRFAFCSTNSNLSNSKSSTTNRLAEKRVFFIA